MRWFEAWFNGGQMPGWLGGECDACCSVDEMGGRCLQRLHGHCCKQRGHCQSELLMTSIQGSPAASMHGRQTMLEHEVQA